MNEPFLAGRRVYVRGLHRTDLPAMLPWINDADVTRLLFSGDRPADVERLAEQWESDLRSHNNIAFAACLRSDDRFIGTTGLYSINWIMRSAEFRVFVGEKGQWNKGIGTELTRLMTIYGFDKLNLNRVWLGVNADNAAAVRAYERAGFVREGVLREEQFRNNRYYDVIRMGILRREYDPRRDEMAAEAGA
jgi:ribosomal-protein-alanine N-acetyltransferase